MQNQPDGNMDFELPGLLHEKVDSAADVSY